VPLFLILSRRLILILKTAVSYIQCILVGLIGVEMSHFSIVESLTTRLLLNSSRVVKLSAIVET
jgi:hypothetical protein